jgi:CubicO group peptidase (beta-lactamase class C family)
MKHTILLLTLLLSFISRLIISNDINDNINGKYVNAIQSLYAKYELQGDVFFAVVNENGMIYSNITNPKTLNNEPSGWSNDSPLYIASHTKSMTGTLLKILEERGVLSLDETLFDYFPELTLDGKFDTKNVTIRHLLSHTHGINSTLMTWRTAYIGYDESYASLISMLNRNHRLDPSHQFRYSNAGPILAAAIAEKATGKTWKTLLNDYIFKPLSMNRTSGDVSFFDKEEIVPVKHYYNNNHLFTSGFFKSDETMHAAGGILSSLNDLAKWLQWNINQETNIVKNSDSFTEIHGQVTVQNRKFFTYQRHGYSLGWDLANYNNQEMLTRFGGFAGMSFHMSLIPEQKLGIIAFSNESRASMITHLMANYVYNLYLDPEHAEAIFVEETLAFEKSFNRAKQRMIPTADMVTPMNSTHDKMIGQYTNSDGWPDIYLSKENESYKMSWGTLNGIIYNSSNPKRPFMGFLGALPRSFSVSEKNGSIDSLFTGSLKYRKIK